MKQITDRTTGWARARWWVIIPAVLLAGAALAVTIDHAATPASATAAKGKPDHDGKKGTPGHRGRKHGSPVAFSSAKWGLIGRNTIGTAYAQPRTGPWGSALQESDPPSGVGSLQIIVGDGTQKVAYGNQNDFFTTRLDTVGTLTYWVYRDIDAPAPTFPGVSFEVLNPTAAVTYTSLVYVPPAVVPTPPALVWRKLDALAGAHWFFTNGPLAASSGCNQTTFCTFAQATAALTNVNYRILSLAVSKGRDDAFNGAVDALRMNGIVYDFEPQGVVERKAH
jgi:hypothetical protein